MVKQIVEQVGRWKSVVGRSGLDGQRVGFPAIRALSAPAEFVVIVPHSKRYGILQCAWSCTPIPSSCGMGCSQESVTGYHMHQG